MKWWLAGVFVAGLGLRLVLAWLPVEALITRTLPDDAYIYFVISRHISSGLGATFDGLQPTNGFHPLWALLIAPIFGRFPAGDLPVHLALTLSAVCDTLAGGLSAWTVWRLAQNRTAAGLTLALYLFNPRLIQESVNGLETGLALLALSCSLAASVWAAARPDSRRRCALFGVCLGLTLLARSDLAVIGILLLGALAWQTRRLAAVLTAGTAWAVTVTPWFLWSLVRVGTIVQSSGVAIPSLVAAQIQATSDLTFLWNSLLFPIVNFSLRNSVIYPGVALLAALLGLALARWPGRFRPISSTPAAGLGSALWLPLAGAILIVVIHTFVRWHPRGWYFAPLAWAWSLAAGPVLAAGLEAPAGRRYRRIVFGLLGLVVVAQSVKMLGEPEHLWQQDMRAGATWLTVNTPPQEIVGAFNAGIYAYYSHRRVINLDGLVDWGAIEARQQGRLLDYFVEQGGTILIDHEAYIESFSAYFGQRRLQEVARLPVADATYGAIVAEAIR